jgi:signal transduction histidine kinase
MSLMLNAALAAAMVVSAGVAQAQERGNAQDAEALLRKAAAHYQAVGKAKALEDFSNDKASFVDRDLYVACIDQAGIWTAHGMNKGLMGRDMTKLMDADGHSLGNLILAAVKPGGEGWVEYRWANPTTKKLDDKRSFVMLIGDQVCGVGFYK